MEIRHR
ncbi:hypothetical protein V1477_014788 [Vespula maculifrons]